jgi:serine/threonine protein kinase
MHTTIAVTHEPLDEHASAEGAHTPAVDALPDGTWLGEFRIIRTLGSGGFGIVYLALDTTLQREVAIKEYLPMAIAKRGSGTNVEVRVDPPTFNAGLESFLYEARLLARFEHPALVKVHQFWKANNTAYMVMRYYPGRTLKEERSCRDAPPDETWLRRLVLPILDALEQLHQEGVYHRDISPDNIVILEDGSPVLLDFGSARRVIGDRTQAVTAVLKPNFAPVEQYADPPLLRQGPWTDLYALGAVVHYLMTGQAPVPAVVRTMNDTLVKLAGEGTARFPTVSTTFLAAIDWSLEVVPAKRPQSVEDLREALVSPRLVPVKMRPTDLLPLGDAMQALALRSPPVIAPAFSRRVSKRAVAACLAFIVAGAGAIGLFGFRSESKVPQPLAQAPVVEPKAVAHDADKTPARQASRKPPSSSVASPTALAASPHAACAGLGLWASSACMRRECSSPGRRQHPDCMRLRADEEARLQKEYSR